jgi:glyoxylase-like metal-dependent hydrolase (beta-lactamase superfamily II)
MKSRQDQEPTVKLNVLISAAVVLAACSSLHAASLPMQSVNRAGEVIDAAVAAHGGAEALGNLRTLVQKSGFVNIATGQSRKPGPPYDRAESVNVNAIDLESEVFFTHNSGSGGGFDFDNGTLINGDDSWQIDYRAGTAAPLLEPDYDTQSGPFIRVTPALLMKQLQARRGQSNWLGVAEIDGRKHDVITLVMEVGPALGLYIDQETHMLTRMERVLPPFGQVEYRFGDYATIDGIAFNRKFELLVNGDENLKIDIEQTEINVSLDPYTRVPANLRQVAAIAPDPMSTNEVKEGVFLIGGNGTYALFVEMDDYVVGIGGTQTVEASIEAMRREIPNKPIRYGVLTHHHNDHIPGAAAYAAVGATIVTFRENEAVVRAAAGDENARLEFVEDRMTISSGGRTIELYNIGPTPHADNMLIAYLPQEGVIFEADHFPQPRNGAIPPAVPATVAFAKALDELGLEYRIIVGAHSPRVGSQADLRSSLGRQETAP